MVQDVKERIASRNVYKKKSYIYEEIGIYDYSIQRLANVCIHNMIVGRMIPRCKKYR